MTFIFRFFQAVGRLFSWLRRCAVTLLWFLPAYSLILKAFGQGIPEPGLILYGVVRNLDGRAPARMTAGPLTCRVTPPTSTAITVTTNLQDVNGQFSYVLAIPFETDIGTGLSANTLPMPAASTSYQIEFLLANAPVRATTVRAFAFSRADRARQQRVDADFMVAFPDADSNGLPDWWENLYFGGKADPKADADRDGLGNLDEYLAGTNPTNRLSALAFVSVSKTDKGVRVEWTSMTNRTYSLLRSTNLLTGFIPLQTNLPATPPRNACQDASPAERGPWFYRVKVE